MLVNKFFFWAQMVTLVILSTVFVFPSVADTDAPQESKDIPDPAVLPVQPDNENFGLEKTLELNFSPLDRARLRKALVDYARNNDPEHIRIKRERQKMRESLKERFTQCDGDLDNSLSRQEVTTCLPQVARHFLFTDVDKDNVVTFEELELAQAKWIERHKAAEAKLEAQRIQDAEESIIQKAAQPKKSKQASAKPDKPS